MIITKNTKNYKVTEQKTQWKLSTKIGSVDVDYNVDKKICPTFANLEKHVAESDLF